ncbi:helix-turn-helix domain-containing protein [Saccharophagus degradans]|uniref:Helix-turn-helix domain-containing protein n=1 Tax=Saccharophagus degradans TaxID=86304 RepID=A0AAW7XAU3_9GAMM|nr:helix-turn-helix domain-containing protein [Saccharophagus degradans]MDO6424788.1 helix-turn-helix domain-containing protein [Saccharophagus degradans]MDO6609672.1 helix-turn-helix domain-containing protein [Saccharophagus degradans]
MLGRIFNIHDVVLIVTIMECLLLALFQLAIPSGTKKDKALLSAFLASIAISSVGVLLLWNDSISLGSYFDNSLLPYFLTVSLLARGPLLFLYVQYLTKENPIIARRHIAYFLPIPIFIGYIYWFGVQSDHLTMRAGEEAQKQIANVIWDFVKYFTVAFAVLSILYIRQYQLRLKQQFSAVSTGAVAWLYLLTAGFLLSWAWGIVTHLLSGQGLIPLALANAFGLAANYMTFILVNSLFVYSLIYAHSALRTNQDATTAIVEAEIEDTAPNRIKFAMGHDKVYLKPNLSIEALAKRIDLPVKTVSSVINVQFNTNFFEYVNTYRVEAAKALLAQPEHAKTPVAEIMTLAGFSSKSAFHRFFKRVTNMSPSEYRKQHSKSN